jgi:hypothetical protein
MPSRALPAPLGARALLAVSLFGAACTGSISGDSSRGSSPSDEPGQVNHPPGAGGTSVTGSGGTPGSEPDLPAVPLPVDRPAAKSSFPACKTLDPGASPLRLMTRVEYDNTVMDLLGDMNHVSADFPPEGRPSSGFNNDVNARAASDLLVNGYFTAAEKLATDAVAQLSKFLPCDPASASEAACVDQFLDGFGKRAWRRPLTQVEKDNLKGAFTEGRTKTFADGVQAVMQVMLMAPQFLYRYEQGAPITATTAAQLTSWEMASRLSYLLWATMPDAQLMQLAETDQLTKPDVVLAQARRLAKDKRFLAGVTNFVGQLLDVDQLPTLDKDTMTLPTWKPELRDPMRTEADRFLEYVLSDEGGGKLSTFLTANFSFLNAPLAAFLGVSGVTGTDFQKVALDPTRSSGFLTQPGWLAVHGNPDDGLTSLVFRGKFVRENLLCSPIPDPPPNAQDENPPFTAMTTAREWSDLRRAKPTCGACHQTMDLIGFGFENFDPIGKYRTIDRGKPVNAKGMLDNSDVDGDFEGVPALGQKLAGSKVVSDCVATQWFRYAAGRAEDTTRDACSLNTLQTAFSGAGGDLRELFVAFTQTDAFLFRSKGDAK